MCKTLNTILKIKTNLFKFTKTALRKSLPIMAINPILTERVRDVLAKTNHVEEKKMFRGIAFM